MSEHKTSEAQLRANRNYRKRISADEEKKARNSYLASRRSAKSFINNKATIEDLEELQLLIELKKEELSS